MGGLEPLITYIFTSVYAVTATFTSSPTWGTWQGWGTSLAWWAARFGDNEALADVFFSLKDDVELNGEVRE